nr:MAG TPA: hypothetical protein [Caudoviricetes sp.]
MYFASEFMAKKETSISWFLIRGDLFTLTLNH